MMIGWSQIRWGQVNEKCNLRDFRHEKIIFIHLDFPNKKTDQFEKLEQIFKRIFKKKM
jgi:hypothetical protein